MRRVAFITMKIPVYNHEGQEITTVEINSKIFDVKIKPWIIQEAVVAQLGNARTPIAHTKTRGEVRGGGKKPWKQKGTGRARHGSIRSPLWKGGGIVFGPTKERNYSIKINKKVKQQALFMLLTEKAKEQNLKILEQLEPTTGKTKEIVRLLTALNIKNKKIIVALPEQKNNYVTLKSARNIPYIKLLAANSLNVVDVASAEILLTTVQGIETIEKTYVHP